MAHHSENLIKIENLSKHFIHPNGQKIDILKNINLDIPRASISGIIGKSGAGKTTLLRCLNLLEKPSSGEIWINQRPMTRLSFNELANVRKKIGMVFQDLHLLSYQTVAQNIGLPLKLERIPKQEIQLRTEKIAKLVGLEDKLQNYPSQLSGGQKQRAAIARALISDSEILLCDEFTSALDPETSAEILDLLETLNQHLGITILLITHDMHVVKKICSHIHVLDSSQIVESGEIHRILTQPQHSITQSLLQSIQSRGLVFV